MPVIFMASTWLRDYVRLALWYLQDEGGIAYTTLADVESILKCTSGTWLDCWYWRRVFHLAVEM